MKDQHAKITGYRDLSESEIEAMNAIKKKSVEVGYLIEEMEANQALDQRWVSEAKMDLQKGFMSAVRSVARPTTF